MYNKGHGLHDNVWDLLGNYFDYIYYAAKYNLTPLSISKRGMSLATQKVDNICFNENEKS